MNPEVWREEAAKRFPDLLGKLTDADSPGMFWIDLHFEFEHAYDSERLDRIAAIYGYAKWCCQQPKGNTAADDLGTIVATHFLEHIPENPRALADMPNWWTIEDVRLMRRRVCAGLGTVRSQVAAKPPFVTVAWGRLQTSTARVIDLRYRQHISPPIRLT